MAISIHECLKPAGGPSHPPGYRGPDVRHPATTTATLSKALSSITLYTTDRCSRCVSAKTLLIQRGIAFQEVNLTRDPDGRAELQRRTGMYTFPQITLGETTIGGFDDLLAYDRAGLLSDLQAA